MEFTGIQKFKAMNDKHTNLKECEGLVIKPVGYHIHNYEDGKGKEHTVLVILNGYDNTMYKTEVAAFIEKFTKYDDSFGDLDDKEKPDIVITILTSKANNKYVGFDLVQPEA